MASNTHSLDLEKSSSQAAVDDGDSASLSITGDLTFEAWVRFEDLQSDAGTNVLCILSKYLVTGNQRSYEWDFLNNLGTKTIRFNISNDGTASNRASWSWTPTIETWYHLAVTWDASASSAEFFINKVSQGTSATGTATACYDSTAKFAIGGSGEGTNNNFDGEIDEVRVWDDIRTSTEISDNWKKDVTGAANLQGYWKFNNDYTDETANSNDLSGLNTPTFNTDVPFATYEVDTVAGGNPIFFSTGGIGIS